MQDGKKILLAVLATLFTSAILASAKSVVDVERLKVKVQTLFDIVKETRDDVKYIKQNLHRRK